MDKENFLELQSIAALQEILEGYARITGLTFGVRRQGDAAPIIRFGARRLCSEFHMAIPSSAEACKRKHAALANMIDASKQTTIVQCEYGLWGGGTPVIVDGRHVATLLMGQVFLSRPSTASLREMAMRLGADPNAYVEAALEVPVISKERLEACLEHLSLIAELIASIEVARRRAEEKSRHLEEEVTRRSRLEKVLEEAKSKLEQEVERQTAQLVEANAALQEQVSKARSAGEALEEQVHFLQSVMDAIPLPIFIKDTDGRYTECNKAFAEIKGMPKDQLIGKTVSATAPAETARICSAADRTVFLHGKVHKYESETVLAGGKTAYLRFHKVPLFDRQGKIKGLVATIIDLTDLKEKEEELKSAKLLMEKIFDSIDTAIILADVRNHTILACNPAAERIFGYTEEELSGQPIWLLQKDMDEFQRFAKEARKALEKGEGFTSMQEMRRKDGSLVHCLHTASFITDDQGDPFAVVCMIRDVTAHTETKRMLRHLESRHELILASAGEGIMGLDSQGRVTFLNPAGEAIVGYTQEELLGRNNHEVLHHKRHDGSPYPEDSCPILRCFKDGEIHRAKEDAFWRKDGSMVWVSYVATPIKEDGRTTGAVVTFQDITEQKRQKEEWDRMNRQLQEAQKMRAIGQLAGGVAHDFNNILTVIQGNAEIASLMIDDSNPLFPRVEEIKRAAEKASALTRQLLAFSRRQPMAKVPVDVNQLITDMLKMLGRLVEENMEIKTDLAEGLPLVEADPGQLEQVVMNLVVNARDAMPTGGAITISTAHAPGTRGSGFVMLSVADEGTGMDAETLERLFEPFFTTKGVGGGTGLGLSVVHGIVEQHGGRIVVDSSPGKGSTFRVFLPAIHDTCASGPSDDPLLSAVPLPESAGRKRVLLVEDDPDVLMMTTDMLKGMGLEVVTARDLSRAKELLREQAFDLVFTDLVLPDGYGLELAELIKPLPGTKLLITTGYSDKVEHLEEIERQAIPLIQKPYSFKEFAALLAELL